MTTQAQQVADLLDNDGGRSLESIRAHLDSLQMAGTMARVRRDGGENLVFGDGSKIVEQGGAWDLGIEGATCDCWEGAGHVEGCPCIEVRCECGEATGERCETMCQAADLVTIETMPEHLRASHEAAGNSGRWPYNGSERLQCSPGCADRMVEADPEWTSIVE